MAPTSNPTHAQAAKLLEAAAALMKSGEEHTSLSLFGWQLSYKKRSCGVRGDLLAESPDGERLNSVPGLKWRLESQASVDEEAPRSAKRRKESAPSPCSVSAEDAEGLEAELEVTKQELADAHPEPADLVGADVCVLAAARPSARLQGRRSVGWRATVSGCKGRKAELQVEVFGLWVKLADTTRLAPIQQPETEEGSAEEEEEGECEAEAEAEGGEAGGAAGTARGRRGRSVATKPATESPKSSKKPGAAEKPRPKPGAAERLRLRQLAATDEPSVDGPSKARSDSAPSKVRSNSAPSKLTSTEAAGDGEAPPSMRCESGHVLGSRRLCGERGEPTTCDACRSKVRRGDVVLSCDACDFDKCEACAGGAGGGGLTEAAEGAEGGRIGGGGVEAEAEGPHEGFSVETLKLVHLLREAAARQPPGSAVLLWEEDGSRTI